MNSELSSLLINVTTPKKTRLQHYVVKQDDANQLLSSIDLVQSRKKDYQRVAIPVCFDDIKVKELILSISREDNEIFIRGYHPSGARFNFYESLYEITCIQEIHEEVLTEPVYQ